MNEEENKDPALQTWIDPELEARVVARVLGEASEFEAAELARIIAEKPELGIFKRRIEAVHGLVAAASRLETDPMRLETQRRRKLMETLEGKPTGSGPAPVVAMPQKQNGTGWRFSWNAAIGIAACLAVAALLASIALPAFSSVQMKAVATKKHMEEKMAERAKAEFEEDGARANGPIAPSPVERLAALDSLKASSRRTSDEEDGAAPAPAAAFGRPEQAAEEAAAPQAGPAYYGTKETDALADAKKDLPQSTNLIANGSAQAGSAKRRLFMGATMITGGSIRSLTGTDSFSDAASVTDPGNGADHAAVAYGQKLQQQQQPVFAEQPVPAEQGPSAAEGLNARARLNGPATGMGMLAGAAAGGRADGNPGPMAGQVLADTDLETQKPAMAVPSLRPSGGARSGGQVQSQDSFLFHEEPPSASRGTAAAEVGAGTLTLSGVNTYTGGATTSAGPSLALNGAENFAPASATLAPARLLAPSVDEVSAADQPYSTFSLHVSDVSFLLAKAALARGEMPDRVAIRPEEFYNAFDYGDPAPGTGEKIACRIEQAAHPALQQRNMVRIAMKVAATGRGQGQPLRLTVLLDTSGSMEREDRAASVRRAMEVLASLLGPRDAVTLIGFARQPRLLAEEVPGDQAGKLAGIAAHTPAEGGTNMEEAIKAASELALRHFEAGAQNRVVMLTDGAANLGDADPAQLAKLVEQLRQKGVSFDACGVGADGLNDDILEALTRKGGGRYYFLNKPGDADEGFARQLAGAFRPGAENVKMQVRFNAARVGKYRLIGFEKHRLNQEDFRNDKVTAAQLAAEEAAVALYQVQVLPEGEGELGEVFVRFRDPADGRMVEQSWTIPYDPQAPSLAKAAPSMQLAATASLLAEKLRGGPIAASVDLDGLAPIVAQLRGHYAGQARVEDLVAMFEKARRMTPQK